MAAISPTRMNMTKLKELIRITKSATESKNYPLKRIWLEEKLTKILYYKLISVSQENAKGIMLVKESVHSHKYPPIP